jgi:hypothetical protein
MKANEEVLEENLVVGKAQKTPHNKEGSCGVNAFEEV